MYHQTTLFGAFWTAPAHVAKLTEQGKEDEENEETWGISPTPLSPPPECGESISAPMTTRISAVMHHQARVRGPSGRGEEEEESMPTGIRRSGEGVSAD